MDSIKTEINPDLEYVMDTLHLVIQSPVNELIIPIASGVSMSNAITGSTKFVKPFVPTLNPDPDTIMFLKIASIRRGELIGT